VQVDSGEREKLRNCDFICMYEPHHASAFTYACRLCGNSDDAQDLLQESVEAALRGFGSLRNPGSFKAWFFRIIHNRHLNNIRRANTSGKFEFHVDEYPVNCIDEITAERAKLVDALNKLNPREREALILYEVEGMQLRDIASIQGRSLSAIKYRMRVGRRTFREAYFTDQTEALQEVILLDDRGG